MNLANEEDRKDFVHCLNTSNRASEALQKFKERQLERERAAKKEDEPRKLRNENQKTVPSFKVPIISEKEKEEKREKHVENYDAELITDRTAIEKKELDELAKKSVEERVAYVKALFEAEGAYTPRIHSVFKRLNLQTKDLDTVLGV